MSRLDDALILAAAGWAVFPCHGKAPLTAHGHHDATVDPAQVASWWRRWPDANIGGPVPYPVVVIDVDPRNGGDQSLEVLEIAHGPLPVTLRSLTGGGGVHVFLIRPGGPLRNGAHQLGRGLDVKLGGRGYIILPGSVTERPYRWEDPTVPIAACPDWLTAALRPEPAQPRPSRPSVHIDTDRPGDQLAERVTWAEILEPEGWRQQGQRGEIGHWTRPGKTEGISATTNALGTDRLYVFTSSAGPFEPDTSYSKFAAWALLNAAGDFREAARLLRRGVGA